MGQANRIHTTKPKASRLARSRRFVCIGALLEPEDEVPPYTPEPWHLVAAVRPDTPHVRARRFLDAAGETLAALILIVGGIGLTGFAWLVGGGA